MPQAGQARQPLGQLHHRLVGEAGQHDVLQLVQLVLERGVDARVAVAEQVDPPRADGIEIALALEIVQPHALAARDRHQRQGFVLLHLGAGVPDRVQAALQVIRVFHLIKVCQRTSLPLANQAPG